MPEYLTPAEVAAELKVHLVTVHRWLRAGELKGLRAGRGWRIQREDVEAFLHSVAPSITRALRPKGGGEW